MNTTILMPDLPGEDPVPLVQVPWIHSHVSQAPPTRPGKIEPPDILSSRSKTFLGKLIPANNPPALIGYYFGIFGLIIAPLAPLAVILGIVGLYRSIMVPWSKGRVHSIVAIVLGVLTMGVIALILLW